MKIIIADNYTTFENLKCGDVFELDWEEGLFMKVEPDTEDSDNQYNVISLGDGKMYSMLCDHGVRLRDDVCLTTINNMIKKGEE